MSQTRKKKTLPHQDKRLERIGIMLKEMRFSEGKNQNGFLELGVSRRQIQRGEYGSNLSLIGLFTLLDCYGYRIDEFFHEME
jgi:hypothetical protein